MTDETRAIIKLERAWAVKAFIGLTAVVLSILGWAGVNLYNALDNLTAEIKELRCEFQDSRVAGVEARAVLTNRIIRLEDQVGIDP